MQTYNLSIITIEDSIASIKSKLQQIINIGSVFDLTSFGGGKRKFISILILTLGPESGTRLAWLRHCSIAT
jgi:hypothetical protein